MSNESSQAAIVARRVSKRIDTATHTVEILRDIDFEVARGKFVAIMGASGSGKSTLLGLLAGLDSPTSGRILLDGDDITGLEEDQLAVLRGRKVGFVFQSYQLIPTLTAEENVLLPLDLAGVRDGRDRASDLLDQVGLLGRRDHYPVQLSGGEQQRVALARAFVMRPPIPVAAGVGSLTGVRGFSDSFRGMLLRDARTLMAADLTARLFALPSETQLAAIRGLEARGVQWTWVTETVTMVSSAAVPEPVLISVKAVDPKVYPFYGEVKLNPPEQLRQALAADSIVVSNDLLLRPKVHVGDTV